MDSGSRRNEGASVQNVRAPEIMRMNISELEIDHSYQHLPYRDAQAELKKNFNYPLCGIILVNIREDGRKVIVDGTTRTQVCIDLGIRYIWAEILRGLTLKEEAAAYLIRAKNKQRQPVDWFHASVIAGDPECLTIQSILDDRKIGVISFATQRSAHDYKATMSCVKTLQGLIRRDQSGDHLCEALDLILDTWGYVKSALASGFLLSIHSLLAQYGADIVRASFISKVGAYPVDEIQEMARGLRFNTTPHISLRSATQKKLVELYNLGRNKGRLGSDN